MILYIKASQVFTIFQSNWPVWYLTSCQKRKRKQRIHQLQWKNTTFSTRTITFWKVAIWAIFQVHTRAISCMIVVWEHFKHFLPFLCEWTAHTRKKRKKNRILAVMFVESISESHARFSSHSLNYFSYRQIVEQLVNSHLDVVLKDNMINFRILFVINVRCSHQQIAKAAPNLDALW